MNTIDFDDIQFEDFNSTDTGNAQILAQLHGDILRWSSGLGWLCFNGKRWAKTADIEVEKLARDVPRYLCSYASTLDDPGKRQMIASQALKAESLGAIKAMVSLLKSEAGVCVDAGVFDADPWLLNVQNGTVDLRTGKLRPHNPNDLLTKITSASFDESAQAPLWRQFISEIMCGNEELIAFLHRYLGYTLAGTTREQSFLFFSGSGANGKSTLCEILAGVLGGYASSLSADALVLKRFSGDRPSNEIAALAGVRFLYANEIDTGATLDSASIKSWTGGDTVKCRLLYREFFEYKPQFTLAYCANGDPRVADTSDGFWRRCKKIPFAASFKKNGDKDLPQKLAAEKNGILLWLLGGLKLYLDSGLCEPCFVTHATETYQRDSCNVLEFLSDRTKHSEAGLSLPLKRLYDEYCVWCAENNETAASNKLLAKRLAESGYKLYKGAVGKMVQDIELEYIEDYKNDGMTEKAVFL